MDRKIPRIKHYELQMQMPEILTLRSPKVKTKFQGFNTDYYLNTKEKNKYIGSVHTSNELIRKIGISSLSPLFLDSFKSISSNKSQTSTTARVGYIKNPCRMNLLSRSRIRRKITDDSNMITGLKKYLHFK